MATSATPENYTTLTDALSGTARSLGRERYWRQLMPYLCKHGLYTPLDMGALIGVCIAYSRLVRSHRVTLEQGDFYESEGEHGRMIRRHPASALASESWRTIARARPNLAYRPPPASILVLRMPNKTHRTSSRGLSVKAITRANRYLQEIVSGKIPACKWVRLAAERQSRDLLRSKTDPGWPYYFDPSEAERICDFIELLPHVSGRWASKGERIVLEPWQCFVLTTIFGWRDRRTGQRRFRQSYLQVARKNAKSTLAAGVALYMLRYDGETGAQVFSGATSERQALEVFRPAKQTPTPAQALTRAGG